jgi:RNA polymerase sigma-70 factor, ECF subfamily
MPADPIGEITALLHGSERGNTAVQKQIVALLYPELRRIAESRMRSERADHTLQPTALVNEFFLRLARQETAEWVSRAHFLAMASEAMKRMLIDYARHHNAGKSGGGRLKMSIDGLQLPDANAEVDIVHLTDLLDQLAAEEPRMAHVVDMKCFGGLTYEEIGESLGIGARTARRDWKLAQLWLLGKLRQKDADRG